MSSLFRQPLLVLFTLLTLVGQAVLSNGHAMVMQEQLPDTAASNTSVAVDHGAMNPSAMGHSASVACHEEQPPAPCCNHADQITPADENASSCCDGDGYCTDDCSHCVTVSMGASLPVANHWPSAVDPEAAPALPLPEFHSIESAVALRPPEA